MFSDGFEMLEQTFLGWAVVVRRHRQAADNTTVVETLRQTNGFRGRISAGSGNHRNTPVGQLQGHHHHIAMLIMTQGGRLTGGANRNDRRGAAGDMIINQFFQARPADFTFLIHRRNKRDNTSREHGPSSVQTSVSMVRLVRQ